MANILKVKNLQTYFFDDASPVRAVDDVSFEMPKGKTFAVVGESGCGKSTLALSLFRLVPPPGRITGGKIVLDGIELTALKEKELGRIRGRRIGLILQDSLSSLNPALRIGTQITETIRRHFSRTRKQAKMEALELMERVRLPEIERLFRTWPHTLSGGQRQRVALAIALAAQPDVLVADEPTTALDVSVQNQILALLQELQQERALSILLITHDLGVVAQTAHHVGVMYAGKMVEQGRIEDVFRAPAHPYTKALLQAAPTFTSGPQFQPALIKNVLPGACPNLRDLPTGCAFHPRCGEAKHECSQTIPRIARLNKKQQVACILYQNA